MNASNPGSRWFWGPWSRLGLQAALITLALDQAHKWWMLKVYGIAAGDRIALSQFLDLVFVKNTGVSYSMFDSSSPVWQLALAAFAAAASLALWVWLARSGDNRLMGFSLGLIIGGALANGLDRILLGGVADFFSLHAFGFYWYVFNIADIAIVAGVAGLLYESVVTSRKDAAKSL